MWQKIVAKIGKTFVTFYSANWQVVTHINQTINIVKTKKLFLLNGNRSNSFLFIALKKMINEIAFAFSRRFMSLHVFKVGEQKIELHFRK